MPHKQAISVLSTPPPELAQPQPPPVQHPTEPEEEEDFPLLNFKIGMLEGYANFIEALLASSFLPLCFLPFLLPSLSLLSLPSFSLSLLLLPPFPFPLPSLPFCLLAPFPLSSLPSLFLPLTSLSPFP
jgi:hypothetical protein